VVQQYLYFVVVHGYYGWVWYVVVLVGHVAVVGARVWYCDEVFGVDVVGKEFVFDDDVFVLVVFVDDL